MTNISIIIPNYNGEKFFEECLEYLTKAIDKCPKSKFELIVVDNASVDNSLSVLAKFKHQNCPTVLIKNTKNMGFAPAINQGIKKAKYDLVLLLNNDINFETNWFNTMINIINDSNYKDYTVFGGTILNREGDAYDSCGQQYYIEGRCVDLQKGVPYNPKITLNEKPKTVWGLSATATIYKKQDLVDIGLFDESFFAYEEDVDLNFRLNRSGKKSLLVPSAITYHLGSATSKRMGNFKQIHDAKNWILLILKNYTVTDYHGNRFKIITERFKNLSGLIKATPIRDLPQSLAKAYGPILKKVFLTKKYKIIQ